MTYKKLLTIMEAAYYHGALIIHYDQTIVLDPLHYLIR